MRHDGVKGASNRMGASGRRTMVWRGVVLISFLGLVFASAGTLPVAATE